MSVNGPLNMDLERVNPHHKLLMIDSSRPTSVLCPAKVKALDSFGLHTLFYELSLLDFEDLLQQKFHEHHVLASADSFLNVGETSIHQRSNVRGSGRFLGGAMDGAGSSGIRDKEALQTR